MYYYNMAIWFLRTPTQYVKYHTTQQFMIFQYNQEYNKTNLSHNIKYTQSEHNTYTYKKINLK